MVTKLVIDRAKAFLCWDKFPQLSIQLVALGDTVAYFYPPHNQRASIVLFYQKQEKDFYQPLFLLFHEVGHYLQYCEFKKRKNLRAYQRLVEAVEGDKKVAFEEEAWNLGQDVLHDFLRKHFPQEKQLLQVN